MLTEVVEFALYDQFKFSANICKKYFIEISQF
jgi:hypothetical protein